MLLVVLKKYSGPKLVMVLVGNGGGGDPKVIRTYSSSNVRRNGPVLDKQLLERFIHKKNFFTLFVHLFDSFQFTLLFPHHVLF